jgi:hypothetical protein
MFRFWTLSGRFALLSMLVVALTMAGLVSIPMPPPLAPHDLSPVLIYAVGILLGPMHALVVVASAQGVSAAYKAAAYSWPPVSVLVVMFVRGFEAFLISLMVGMKPSSIRPISGWEVAAMAVGALLEVMGLFLADWLLFGCWRAMLAPMAVADVVFIPLAILVVAAARRMLRVERLLFW